MDSYDNIPQIIYSLAVLMLLITALYSRKGFTKTNYFKYAVLWAVIILVCVFLYSVKRDFSTNYDFSKFSIKDTIMAELRPSAPIDKGDSIEILQSDDSHYYLEAKVNGQNIRFLIDTGATYNVLGINYLKSMNYNLNTLDYIFSAKTGGGTVQLAYASLPTTIMSHDLGYMSYMITKEDSPQIAILGMNFLKKFQGFRVERERMILELR